jgi:hypothetical protein
MDKYWTYAWSGTFGNLSHKSTQPVTAGRFGYLRNGQAAFVLFSDVGEAILAREGAESGHIPSSVFRVGTVDMSLEKKSESSEERKSLMLSCDFVFTPDYGSARLQRSELERLDTRTKPQPGHKLSVARANILVVKCYEAYLPRYCEYLSGCRLVIEVLWCGLEKQHGKSEKEAEGAVVVRLLDDEAGASAVDAPPFNMGMKEDQRIKDDTIWEKYSVMEKMVAEICSR